MAIKTEKNGFEFASKTKAIIVFVGIIVILSGSFIIHLNETQDSFKVENIPYNQVDTVEISDRKLFGNSSVIISNKDSILILNKLLIDSKLLSIDNINIRANQGESDITIHLKNSKPIKLYLINTDSSGGILQPGDCYYQNTLLLNFIMNKLRSNNRSDLN